MYSRQSNRDFRIPVNYGGSVFDRKSASMSTPVEDLTVKRHTERASRIYPLPPQEYASPEPECEQAPENEECCECCECSECERRCEEKDDREQSDKREIAAQSKKGSLLSPIGELGTEEILLIALALIIFQGGNDPELSLILLALLFIS